MWRLTGWIVALILMVPVLATAQSSEVLPGQLMLDVKVEETEHTPFVREMVLVTIKGTYRRHITLENLVQPDFEGFSWAQLGPDNWREERIDGLPVKIFERRMAVYPDRAGRLTIGAFRHDLTLTDEGDDWFEHQIHSEPVTIEVMAAPSGEGWWFPTRSLRVSDQWSNAPDQLAPGEGVLRVVRLEALGVTPEMIPPMPTLTSPSAMIFPHPEKRLVELTPEGPMTYAFWRWTIRPGNDTSTIVEPLTFDYYDTTGRLSRSVTISAQRVAYGTVTGAPPVVPQPEQARLPGRGTAVLAALVFVGGIAAGLWGRSNAGLSRLQRMALFDPLARRLRRMARAGHPSETRRAAAAILNRDPEVQARKIELDRFDAAVFRSTPVELDLKGFARKFLSARN